MNKHKNSAFRIFSVLLLFLYVSVQSPLHEIIKLPTLVAHFIEHKEKDPNISFMDFIDDHYIKNTDSQDHFHKKLPFKDENHPLMIGFHYMNTEKWEQSPLAVKCIQTFSPLPYRSLSLGEPNGVWQPPKSC